MERNTTKDLCTKALLIALVTVATMIIQIPMPATSGYVHLGDSVILISSVFFGWKYGMVAGGIGSAMADVFTGYGYWAPFTLIIKGFMGYAVGKMANYSGESSNFFSKRNVFASVIGEIWMVLGYLLGGAVLKGSLLVSLASVPGNIVQAGGGLVIFLVIGYALDKAKIYKFISVR